MEVLKMVANIQSVIYVSNALGLREKINSHWKYLTKGKERVSPKHDTSSLVVENQQFKVQVLQLEKERAIFKKALTFLTGKLSGALLVHPAEKCWISLAPLCELF